MQIQVDIAFDDLVRIVKKLPKDQFLKFKKELEGKDPGDARTQDLESFLLGAPIFSDEQIETVAQTRKAINEWRKN
ncbi:MAG: hypothetical protein ACXVIY_02580 [Mucilaginibacter sp.]